MYFLIVFLITLLLGLAYYIHKKNIYIWIIDYFIGKFALITSKSKKTPIDIMFLMVDHFELANKPDRLSAWINEYPLLVNQFKDADGIKPQHTWFSAIDLINEHELKKIQVLVETGYGEVELHWHHSHASEEKFRSDLKAGLEIFHKYGFMRPYNNKVHSSFSFIHGNWSLNNSRGSEFCGIENEIAILKEFGCYADFTFPALFSPAQPKYVNKITYVDSNGLNKSYDKARIASVNNPQTDDEFMIMQGPLSINWKDWRHKWHPTFEDGDINNNQTQGSKKRIDNWIKQRIHVRGRANWVFVKTFCHGAQDYKSLTSSATYEMYKYLGEKYNDGSRYRLHYVTARECFNIIKAAEAGNDGNPNDYRDFVIPRRVN